MLPPRIHLARRPRGLGRLDCQTTLRRTAFPVAHIFPNSAKTASAPTHLTAELAQLQAARVWQGSCFLKWQPIPGEHHVQHTY